VWVAIGVELTRATGTTATRACKVGCMGSSECTSRPEAAFLGAGAECEGVAVVDKTKGLGDGRNGADKECNTVLGSRGWCGDDADGGLDDDGAPVVGIAVVVSVMGGKEATELDGAAAAMVGLPDVRPSYTVEYCVEAGTCVVVLVVLNGGGGLGGARAGGSGEYVAMD
jgi:hypothetical protein